MECLVCVCFFSSAAHVWEKVNFSSCPGDIFGKVGGDFDITYITCLARWLVIKGQMWEVEYVGCRFWYVLEVLMDFRARPFQFHCLCMALWTARPRLRTERFWAKTSEICDGNSHKIWEDWFNTLTDWLKSGCFFLRVEQLEMKQGITGMQWLQKQSVGIKFEKTLRRSSGREDDHVLWCGWCQSRLERLIFVDFSDKDRYLTCHWGL